MKTISETTKNMTKANIGWFVQQTAFGGGSNDLFIEEIIEFVAKESKGFQKDICEKVIKYSHNGMYKMSEKQAYCVFYEFLKLNHIEK